MKHHSLSLSSLFSNTAKNKINIKLQMT